jgi:serine/threonine protein kinase
MRRSICAPSLPPTISRIVVKLLQKSPEMRYQTARALHRDLVECRSQLERNGVIENDFPLGTADAPYRPLFSKKLQVVDFTFFRGVLAAQLATQTRGAAWAASRKKDKSAA